VSPPTLTSRLSRFPLPLFLGLLLLAGIGTAGLYSAGGLNWQPWAANHIIRFGVAVGLAVMVGCVPLRWWKMFSYPAYGVAMLGLVAVELFGTVGMGAQRWLDLGFVRLQPSELMKPVLIMTLAAYLGERSPRQMRHIKAWGGAFLLIAAPVVLVLMQPNLGTAMLLAAGGLAVVFVAGAPLWLFVSGMAAVAVSLPVAWQYGLHDYQKRRVMTFLDPSQDPLGAGFHITQSKIAFGSGGMEGRGFGQGPQSQLSFLPEKHNDFIFALLCEEFGFVGGIVILTIAAWVLLCGWRIAFAAASGYGRLLATGITVTFFLYVFINTGMVMGLLPVVGIPFPLVSDGGTVMLSVMIAAGLLASIRMDGVRRRYRRGGGTVGLVRKVAP
jgi:rod shape determining protein RodA